MNVPTLLASFDRDSFLLTALANPRRLEILHLLANQTLSVTALYEMLDLPQANISQHLSVLKKAGVIRLTKNGRERLYSLADERYLQICYTARALSGELQEDQTQEDMRSVSLQSLVPLAHDPVCGMVVSTKVTPFSTLYAGDTYYFCASGCYQKFMAKPAQYADSSKKNSSQ